MSEYQHLHVICFPQVSIEICLLVVIWLWYVLCFKRCTCFPDDAIRLRAERMTKLRTLYLVVSVAIDSGSKITCNLKRLQSSSNEHAQSLAILSTSAASETQEAFLLTYLVTWSRHWKRCDATIVALIQMKYRNLNIILYFKQLSQLYLRDFTREFMHEKSIP